MPPQKTEIPIDPELSGLDDRQLIERAQTNSLALSVLYRRHFQFVFGYIYRRVGNSNDANDITAEVFVSMVRYLPGYRWTGAPFQAWLLRIATTQINRWLRKRRWSRFWETVRDNQTTRTQEHGADDRLESVRQALLKLPTRFQTVLTLHYFEDLSVESIAQVLGCPPGTVKSRLSRGRDSLRNLLSKEEEPSGHEERPIGILPKKTWRLPE